MQGGLGDQRCGEGDWSHLMVFESHCCTCYPLHSLTHSLTFLSFFVNIFFALYFDTSSLFFFARWTKSPSISCIGTPEICAHKKLWVNALIRMSFFMSYWCAIPLRNTRHDDEWMDGYCIQPWPCLPTGWWSCCRASAGKDGFPKSSPIFGHISK